MLVKEAIADYIAARRAEGLAPATIESLEERLGKLAKFLVRKRRDQVSEVRREDVDEFAGGMIQQGLKFKTRRAYLHTAQGFFAWLHRRGKVLTDPSQGILVPPADEQPLPDPPLTETEVTTLLDTMPRRSVVDIRNRLQLELLYSCGLRLSESLRLMLVDIDTDTRSVRVKGKGGKLRVLPLMKGALNALKDYLALRRSMVRGPDNGVLLIGRFTGKPLHPANVQPLIRKAVRRAGLKRRVHAHLFRHSIAVHLLQRGADIRHVQEFLGHASIDTTKIYLRMVPGRLKEDYDRAMPAIAVTAHP